MNTQQYFNNFYKSAVETNSNTYDAILSYFEQQTGSAATANQLVQSIVDTASAQNIDPLEVLNSFINLKASELTPLLALFLNTGRANTSYLGVKLQPQRSQFVTRSILN